MYVWKKTKAKTKTTDTQGDWRRVRSELRYIGCSIQGHFASKKWILPGCWKERGMKGVLNLVRRFLCERLLVSQSHHGVDAYGAMCGNVAGGERDGRKQNGHASEC